MGGYNRRKRKEKEEAEISGAISTCDLKTDITHVGKVKGSH